MVHNVLAMMGFAIAIASVAATTYWHAHSN